jgi:hypothetical protein
MLQLIAARTAQLLVQLSNPEPVIPGNRFTPQNGADSRSAFTTSISSAVATLSDLLWLIAGAMAMISLLRSGIRYIQAQEDAKAAAEARKTLISTFIGVILLTIVVFLIQLANGSGRLVNAILNNQSISGSIF